MKTKYKYGGMRPETEEYGGGGMYYGKEGLKMVEKDGKKVPFFTAEGGKKTRRGRMEKYNERPNSAYNPESEYFNPFKERFARNVLKQNPNMRYGNQLEALERKLVREHRGDFGARETVYDPPRIMGTEVGGVPGIEEIDGERVMTRPGMGVSLADEQAQQNQKAMTNRVLQALVAAFASSSMANGRFAPIL